MRSNHILRPLRLMSKIQQRHGQPNIKSSLYHVSAMMPSSLLVSRDDQRNNYDIETRRPCRLLHQYQITRTYGSKTVVELEEHQLPGMERIQPYMRSSLIASGESVEATKGMNMEFAVSFLGTGGGSPSRHRLGTCTALRLGGNTYLFDVTEGTFRQLESSRILASSISKIFISHMHGDHLFGLVPLILGIAVAHKQTMKDPNRSKRHKNMHGERAFLEIYGPPGIYNYINMVLTLSCSKANWLNINVIELVGGRAEQGPPSSRPKQRGRRNIFLSHYPEAELPLVRRQYLEKNQDGVWVIDEPEGITNQSIMKGAHIGAKDGFDRLPNDVNLSVGRRLHIKAAELNHLTGVQTFGYTIEEQQPPGNIDLDKAKAMGVQPSKKYGLLKCGITVQRDDGMGEVHPYQVLSETFRPRKVAILSDHRFIPKPMAQLCKDADLLVHEATLARADSDKIKIRGHNTAYNAGVFGREMGCKVVALNHFGNTVVGREFMSRVLAEAREGNQNACQIIASFDFLEVWIPRGGFDL